MIYTGEYTFRAPGEHGPDDNDVYALPYAVELGSSLAVAGAATLGSSLAVAGATTLGSSLVVAGTATLDSSLVVAGTSTFNGGAVFNGALTLDSALNVAGAVAIGGTLAVTGAAALSTLSASIPGVFTNTEMENVISIAVGGINQTTEFHWTHPGNYSIQAIVTGVEIPSGSTAYDATGIASYVANSSTVTSGTGGEFYVRNAVAGATVYGLNPLVTDQNSDGTTGVQSTMVGAEFDIGAFNTLSVAYGINMIGVFPNGTPATAVAYQVAILNAPWQFGLLFGDGATTTAIQIGAAALTANSNSQPINLLCRDSSNTERLVGIVAQSITSGANLVLQTPTGGLVVSGLELTTSLATFAAGISVTAAAGNLAAFYSGTTQVGSITVSDSVTNYNTTSDYRLKTLDGPADGSAIDKLKVYTGAFKADSQHTKRSMLIAHEAQAVAPWAVTGTKDAVHTTDVVSRTGHVIAKKGDIIPQLVDHSALVPDLIAKAQTHTTQIAAVTQEVALLKQELAALRADLTSAIRIATFMGGRA